MALFKETEWRFTVKKIKDATPDNVTVGTYDQIFERFKKICSLKILLKAYEYDPQGIGHYHGILSCNYQAHPDKIRVRGFTICIEPIGDKKAWARYCLKDQPKMPISNLFSRVAYTPTEMDLDQLREWANNVRQTDEPDAGDQTPETRRLNLTPDIILKKRIV